jgi:hypothetical protein
MRHRRTAERRQVDALQCAHPGRRRRRRRTIRSAPSSRTPARWRCPTRASTRWRRSASRSRSCRRRLTFVDIAGLVRGASKGEGLGNQFLANIREVDAIAHVLRCFEDGDVTHVENRIDPVADAETVETELMLSDLDSLERRIVPLRKRAANDKEIKAQVDLMERALTLLREGKPARLVQVAARRAAHLRDAEPAHRQAGALRLQRRRGLCRPPATRCRSAWRRWRRRKAPKLRRHLGGKIEGGDRPASARRAEGLSSKRSALRSPASTG